MENNFVELTANDDDKVTIVIRNVAWFKAEDKGTMVMFNFMGTNNFPFVLRVKEDYAKVRSLIIG